MVYGLLVAMFSSSTWGIVKTLGFKVSSTLVEEALESSNIVSPQKVHFFVTFEKPITWIVDQLSVV